MPFKSEKQRRFMWANHPDIAQRWADEYGSKIGNMNALARARKAPAKTPGKAPKLGNGQRFEQLKNKLAKKGKVSNPAAVAAAIGRKKYGAKKMAQMSAAGRRSK